MPRATWNNTIIAESDDFETVEGNIYFPPSALKHEFFEPSETKSICGWKGTARYYTVNVDGVRNEDAAWYYPEPKEAAAKIKDYVAFWRGVDVHAE